ncbi:MAG: CDP-glucose 4,6-dehydratase [Actinomycetota bacterium]
MTSGRDASNFWQGKKVLITGNTGFKGSWLTLWLRRLGAVVEGLALDPPTKPAMFDAVGLRDSITWHHGDVQDTDFVTEAVRAAEPDVVFHLAAQVLVRDSYDDPVHTIATNVMGTTNVLNAARQVPALQSLVVITSDKCYENLEWHWAYREDEQMGGHDPYSASKGCAELITSSMRRSFYAGPDTAWVGSARAGNVIGGGDWSTDRLIPDIVKAFAEGEEVVIRMPEAIRPWQHVLEPLSGYIMLAEQLATAGEPFAEGWNFGPADAEAMPVGWIVEQMAKRWGEGASFRIERDGPHEAKFLKLDSSKARNELGWRPRLSVDMALDWVVDWSRAYLSDKDMEQFTIDQIAAYEALPLQR